MRWHRSAGIALVGLVWLSMAGCEDGAPPSGSRAIVPANYLEKQRVKIEEMKASMKTRPVSRPAPRR